MAASGYPAPLISSRFCALITLHNYSTLQNNQVQPHCFRTVIHNHSLYLTNIFNSDRVYRVRQIKVTPYHVLLIHQERIGIFARKFTWLFIIHILRITAKLC